MNIIKEVLEKYPTTPYYTKKFIEQFKDWTDINQYGNINPIDLKLEQSNTGSDRVIYNTCHPDILLKAAFGPQEMIVPPDLEFLYLPVLEFEFPIPLQDPYYEDGRPFGQFQLKINKYRHFQQLYLPTRALQKKAQENGCCVSFAKELLKSYGEEIFNNFFDSLQKYQGMRAPSDQNWGFLNDKPIIFDYGRIITND